MATWPDSVVWPLGLSVVWPLGLILYVWPPRPDLLYGHLAYLLYGHLGLISLLYGHLAYLYGHLGRFLYSQLAELVDVWPPRPIDCTAT